MWTRRTEQDSASSVTGTMPRPSELAGEGIPFSTASSRGQGIATIGKAVVIKGQIFGREDLYIDGEVEGSVEVADHQLTIGPNGKVKASVKAREVIVEGTLHGNLEASERAVLGKNARMVGDIQACRLVIQEGAFFRGQVNLVREATSPEQRAASVAGSAQQ